MELQLRLCSAGSLEFLGHHHGAAASQELFHPGLGWDAPSLAGLGSPCLAGMLGVADSSLSFPLLSAVGALPVLSAGIV